MQTIFFEAFHKNLKILCFINFERSLKRSLKIIDFYAVSKNIVRLHGKNSFAERSKILAGYKSKK